MNPNFKPWCACRSGTGCASIFLSWIATGSTTITEPIIFRDVVLQPGDPAYSTLNLSTFSITYEYSFFHTEKYEVAATIGVTETDISARARVTTTTRHVDQSEDQAGPFPTGGIDATYVFSKRWYVDGRAQYMHLSYNNLSGSLGYGEFDVLYRLRPNISFALGYTIVRANLDSRQTTQGGYFNFTSKGPEVLRQSRVLADNPGARVAALGAAFRRKLDPIVRGRRAIPFAGGEGCRCAPDTACLRPPRPAWFSIATVIAPAVRWRTPSTRLANASDSRCWLDRDSSKGLPIRSQRLTGSVAAASVYPSVPLPLRQ